jgi:small subunit ribosomal protein S20
VTRTEHNKSVKSAVKTSVKKLLTAIEAKDKDQINAILRSTVKLISSGVTKGVFHKNTASRTISRLSKRANKALTTEAA